MLYGKMQQVREFDISKMQLLRTSNATHDFLVCVPELLGVVRVECTVYIQLFLIINHLYFLSFSLLCP